MSSRYRTPETVTLQISRGDWLLVKKHLTAGESKQMLRFMMDDSGEIDRVLIGTSKMVAYILDWSIDDAAGKRVVILEKSDGEKLAAFDGLPTDAFQEIMEAVEAHEDKMQAERSAEKNALAGGSTSLPLSPSVPDSQAGPSNTLTDSTLTSIAS